MAKRLSALFILLACLASAAGPVATLTAGPGVTLNGRTLQTAGAPTWPLAANDEVVTAASASVIAFPDGATLKLAPHTRVAVPKSDRSAAQLFEGSVDYNKPSGSAFELCALGRPVRPGAGTQGSVVVEGPGKVAVRTADAGRVGTAGECAANAGLPWAGNGMSTATKVAIVTAAAAVATGVTIAVTRPKDKSPKGKSKGQDKD